MRSSLARRLGLEQLDGNHVSQRSEGLAQLMLDATQRFAEPLTLQRLLGWQEWLFPDQDTDLASRSIRVGALRGDDPMSLQQAMTRIGSVLGKARFWQAHRQSGLSAGQTKVLNRLLDGGERGFEGGISAAQYQSVATVSKATATRHLTELLAKGCLIRLPSGGRSTRYQINYPDPL